MQVPATLPADRGPPGRDVWNAARRERNVSNPTLERFHGPAIPASHRAQMPRVLSLSARKAYRSPQQSHVKLHSTCVSTIQRGTAKRQRGFDVSAVHVLNILAINTQTAELSAVEQLISHRFCTSRAFSWATSRVTQDASLAVEKQGRIVLFLKKESAFARRHGFDVDRLFSPPPRNTTVRARQSGLGWTRDCLETQLNLSGIILLSYGRQMMI
jgi:hypothetical protein